MCIKVLKRIEDSLKGESEVDKIKEKLRDVCGRAKGKENRFVSASVIIHPLLFLIRLYFPLTLEFKTSNWISELSQWSVLISTHLLGVP